MSPQYIEPVPSLHPLHPLRLTDLPGRCAVCLGWGRGRLCAACLDRFAQPKPRCHCCAIEVPAGAVHCADCIRDTVPYDHAVAAVDYDYPWDGLLRRFKFHASLDLAAVLAALLSAAAAAAIDAGRMPRPTWLVPVPLGAGRLRERGYNQAWELARRVARAMRTRADAGLLARLRDTPTQTGATRKERERQLHDAFLVEPRRLREMQGTTVAIVDDVSTSGATAAEAARALRKAGVACVQLWVVARTPRD